MGYRSEVRIATTKEGYDLMCDFVDAHTKEGEAQLIGRDVKPEIFEKHGGDVAFGWKCIKWYEEECVDVKNIVDALDALGCDEVPYRLVRVGEDWDDIEVEGSDVDLSIGVYPVTGIETVKWEV